MRASVLGQNLPRVLRGGRAQVFPQPRPVARPPLFSLLTPFLLQFGERFEFDCKDCVCLEGGRGIICQPRKCSQKPLPECKEDGTYLVTEVNPTDTCCTISSCSKATPGGGEPSLGPRAPVPS